MTAGFLAIVLALFALYVQLRTASFSVKHTSGGWVGGLAEALRVAFILVSGIPGVIMFDSGRRLSNAVKDLAPLNTLRSTSGLFVLVLLIAAVSIYTYTAEMGLDDLNSPVTQIVATVVVVALSIVVVPIVAHLTYARINRQSERSPSATRR